MSGTIRVEVRQLPNLPGVRGSGRRIAGFQADATNTPAGLLAQFLQELWCFLLADRDRAYRAVLLDRCLHRLDDLGQYRQRGLARLGEQGSFLLRADRRHDGNERKRSEEGYGGLHHDLLV